MFRFQRAVDLDANATTALSRRVRRAIGRVLRRQHGNPSSAHRAGRVAAAILQDSREAVARAIHAEPDEIVFTSGASEANNQVLQAFGELRRGRAGRILSTPIEHPSIMSPLAELQKRGCKVEFVPVDAEGRVRFPALEEMLEPGADLLCCMLANNEIGTLQDLPKISALAHARGVPILCDAVQALGKIPVDVKALDVDYASFSAHKLHGPKGVGALYLRRGSEIAPLLHGGHQEAGLRAGTESVHGIAGFAEACRALPELLAKSAAVAERRDALLASLRAIRPDLVAHSPTQGCLPNTLSLRFPGESSAELSALLDLHGVAVSAGSACSTGQPTPSHVLLAIGLSAQEADETIRISLSDRTSRRALARALEVMRGCLEGERPPVTLIRPSQVDEAFFRSDDNFVLDVRFEVERKLMKGLPGSHEASLIAFGRYVDRIPRQKNVLVVCSTGINATAIAYTLHSRGYRRVGLLLGGVVGWQLQQPGLYRRLAGTARTKLEPRA